MSPLCVKTERRIRLGQTSIIKSTGYRVSQTYCQYLKELPFRVGIFPGWCLCLNIIMNNNINDSGVLI